MRLSDAGLRRRQTKALYPDHRLPPWSTEDATRDRSSRLLDDSQRSRNLDRLPKLPPFDPSKDRDAGRRVPCRVILRRPALLGNVDRADNLEGELDCPAKSAHPHSSNEAIQRRPTKWASSGGAEASNTRFSLLARRPNTTSESSPHSCRLTMRLSDAGVRCRPTKPIYPNHSTAPWPTDDATRDRSSRLLDARPGSFTSLESELGTGPTQIVTRRPTPMPRPQRQACGSRSGIPCTKHHT